ncbi:putative calponin -like proteiny domain-containing protein-like isoform X2 [Capsicum annuum]|nr:putative calponin -like proteiny domain-containing protein-like isoform X2 [Capsicum annuum]KAF3653158.1 putative calponin -like proteiny domain-containing protein-like isoform X2 [Capsicum annuum]
MAANKFATMLHKNTNKITMVLMYAVLEWILIILLLLNSFFSYMIIKFAEYFGLKPPCPLCSRIDHAFDHQRTKTFRRDLVCEIHTTELSKLGFCLNHQKLTESQDLCEDCSSSRHDFCGVLEDGEVNLKCSCCGVILERKFSTLNNDILTKPYSDDLGKGNLAIESKDDDLMDKGYDFEKERSDFAIGSCGNEEKTDLSDFSLPVSEIRKLEDSEDDGECLVLEGITDYIEEHYRERVMKDEAVQVCVIEDSSFEFSPQHLDFFVECSGQKLVPVELIDSITEEDHSQNQPMHENYIKNNDEVNFSSEEQVNDEVELVVENKIEEEPKFIVLDSMEMEENENGFGFCVEECLSVKEVHEQFDNTQLRQALARDNVQIEVESVREEKDSDVQQVSEEASQTPQINEIEAEVLIGNEIPIMNLSDEISCQVSPNSCTHEEPSTRSAHFHEIDQHGTKEDQEKLVQLKLLSVELEEHVMNKQSSISSKLDETEEEKVPETPTSTDSFHQLHKKLLLFEKKDFGTESFDGSVVSELEGGDTASSIEHLKSALKAERKALHALYTELEEERSASAVAANQTMAMINKLQEEKSAMQMEALQYQRMMEEQSEYDQEALQLLNELMVKREKEKQELEKELEVYRKRLSEYEAKEKAARMLKRSKDGSVARSGFSSASYSNGEESEEVSIDLNQEPKDCDSFYCHQECEDHKVQVDAVQELEESFVDFEEERMSILVQLKILEEKLITMDDEDTKGFEDVRPMDDSYRENGNHTKEISHLDVEIDGHANGFLSEMNGKHHPQKIVNAEGKGLLPLFDAMSDENGDVMLNGHENGYSNGGHEENKRLDVEEELDYLHERLQALEADREFLKNCVSSLKKGDKGMDLLHEILQHLRDLKNVDLRVRSSCNSLM